MDCNSLFLPSCVFFCFFSLLFTIQTVGFFTPMWASNRTCDSIGLLYSCCTGSDNKTCGNTNGGDELDKRALGLHATSFALIILAMLLLCCGMAGFCLMTHNGDDQSDDCCADLVGSIVAGFLGFTCQVFFSLVALLNAFVAGIFSLIGCIIVSTKFATSELGYSFYLSLTASCLMILSSGVTVCLFLRGYK